MDVYAHARFRSAAALVIAAAALLTLLLRLFGPLFPGGRLRPALP